MRIIGKKIDFKKFSVISRKDLDFKEDSDMIGNTEILKLIKTQTHPN